MKKSVIAAIIVIIIAVVAVAAVASKRASAPSATSNSTKQSTAQNTQSQSPTDGAAQSPSMAPSTTASVVISGFAFNPQDLTIKKGTTVTWTNQDDTAHTVTESDGQTGPNSGDLGKGKTYSFTYGTVGTFKYKCSIHPNMTGTVTVTQ